MKWFLYFISFSWITIGSCFVLYTDQSRKMLKKLYFNLPKEVLIIMIIAFGIFFIMASSYSRNTWIIVTFGILAICKGVLFL